MRQESRCIFSCEESHDTRAHKTLSFLYSRTRELLDGFGGLRPELLHSLAQSTYWTSTLSNGRMDWLLIAQQESMQILLKMLGKSMLSTKPDGHDPERL